MERALTPVAMLCRISEHYPTAQLELAPEIVIPGSTMADIERHAVLRTLEATGGSTTRAAAILGMSVRAVQYRMQKYSAAPKGSAA